MAGSKYRKCVLEKPVGKFRQRRTDWVPERLAVAGYKLRWHLQAFVWDTNWLVMEVGESSPEGFVPDSPKTWDRMPS